MRSIPWRHFEWPWVASTLDSKVATFFNVKKLEMVQDKATRTMADEYEVVYDLSNGAIFNNIERSQARFQGHDV